MTKGKLLIFPALFMLYFTSAQEKIPTVEEIYTKYIDAIGGKERLKEIATQQTLSIVTTEAHSEMYSDFYPNGVLKNTTETNSKTLSFVDNVGERMATITSSANDEYSRILLVDGKFYLLTEDGRRTETPVAMDSSDWGMLNETVSPGSQLMPSEVVNGEEVQVIKYEMEKIIPSMITNDRYEYFSKSSGLLVGSKTVTATVIGKEPSTTTMITEFKDYREIGGILIAHQKNTDTTIEGSAFTSTSTVSTVIQDVQFNVDMEIFKIECFQQPKECFESISENIKQ